MPLAFVLIPVPSGKSWRGIRWQTFNCCFWLTAVVPHQNTERKGKGGQLEASAPLAGGCIHATPSGCVSAETPGASPCWWEGDSEGSTACRPAPPPGRPPWPPRAGGHVAWWWVTPTTHPSPWLKVLWWVRAAGRAFESRLLKMSLSRLQLKCTKII